MEINLLHEQWQPAYRAETRVIKFLTRYKFPMKVIIYDFNRNTKTRKGKYILAIQGCPKRCELWLIMILLASVAVRLHDLSRAHKKNINFFDSPCIISIIFEFRQSSTKKTRSTDIHYQCKLKFEPFWLWFSLEYRIHICISICIKYEWKMSIKCSNALKITLWNRETQQSDRR